MSGMAGFEVPLDHQDGEVATSEQQHQQPDHLVLQGQGETVQVYAMDMDISEPVGTLKARAGEALHLQLDNYTVWVLSEHRLEDTETLQQQCGTEAGLVQVQFVVKKEDEGGRIDIIDVLKPNEGDTVEDTSKSPSPPEPSAVTTASTTTADNTTTATPSTSKSKAKVTRWIVCPTFKELQRVLKIPQDPQDWTKDHVSHWLCWASRQFGVNSGERWDLTGRELFALSQTDFRRLVPHDPDDVFYMHFELLRRTNVVAVVCDPLSDTPRPVRPKITATRTAPVSTNNNIINNASNVNMNNKRIEGREAVMQAMEHIGGPGVGGGGSQQIQLWQFLLELLTDPKVSKIISWCGGEGQFRLHEPEIVANLWGQRKSKPNMNYEKLSRALRYYYDGEMIAKVSGKRFVYRFVLDLRSVLGYSADELRSMVEHCRDNQPS